MKLLRYLGTNISNILKCGSKRRSTPNLKHVGINEDMIR